MSSGSGPESGAAGQELTVRAAVAGRHRDELRSPRPSAVRQLSGHVRTIVRLLVNTVRPPTPPPSERWRTVLEDPITGAVPVTGWLTAAVQGSPSERAPQATPAGSTLLVLVHGLGGSAESPYVVDAAHAARRVGLSSLRLNLRGADSEAGDFYHAGLTAELHAAVADQAFADCRRIVLLGYSLGGHVVLRYAAEVEDPRVTAAVAVCTPLHLSPCAVAFERPSRAPYRNYALRNLRRRYAALERPEQLPNPAQVVGGARTIREWDRLTVVPRFGFADPEDYYRQASAAVVLDRLRVPSLLVVSDTDPMTPPETVSPYLPPGTPVVRRRLSDAASVRSASGPPALTVLWHPDAGHVAFPRDTDLGLPAPPGLEAQTIDWLLRTAGRGRDN